MRQPDERRHPRARPRKWQCQPASAVSAALSLMPSPMDGNRSRATCTRCIPGPPATWGSEPQTARGSACCLACIMAGRCPRSRANTADTTSDHCCDSVPQQLLEDKTAQSSRRAGCQHLHATLPVGWLGSGRNETLVSRHCLGYLNDMPDEGWGSRIPTGPARTVHGTGSVGS